MTNRPIWDYNESFIGHMEASMSPAAKSISSSHRRNKPSILEVKDQMDHVVAHILYSEQRAAILYHRSKGVDAYVQEVACATPMELISIERQGVQGAFIKDLSKRMDLATSRLFVILGLPKATAEKKAAAGELVTGRGGQAAIGMIKLLGIAQQIVQNSTSPDAQNFDAAKWLGHWIERPQPSLGGQKPADLIDTPTGVEIVSRLLGSIESGAFQ